MNRKNVIVNRMGGLGNQLFQYAAARAVARHHPEAQIYIGNETENSHNHKCYDYANLFMKYAVLEEGISCGDEFRQSGPFTPWHPETLSPPIKLCGYFQYFPAIEKVLPDLIVEFKGALQNFIPEFVDPKKSVFIHVRRGDYLRLPGYHYIQTQAYYENAFREWLKRYQGDDFNVFMVSDDPQWCRDQPWSFPRILYENDDEIATLALMSQCQAGAIIANSSFSYWGAILTESPNVFYPKNWINETVHDLFPSEWVCVSG
jgi:hypothetical protein